MSSADDGGRGLDRPGWRALRREREAEGRGNFGPLREAIQRHELVGSMVELFVSALVGVTKIGLDAADATGPLPAPDSNSPWAPGSSPPPAPDSSPPP